MKQQKVNAILEMLDSYSPTCSHVRGWDVNAGSEEPLLGELHGESASDQVWPLTLFFPSRAAAESNSTVGFS